MKIRTAKFLALIVFMIVLGSLTSVRAQTPCGSTITVVRGDTIASIARRCNTSVSAILELNPEITDVRSLRVGQILNMPLSTGGTGGPPIVALSPLSGPPGTSVQVVANGFPANSQVVIGLGRAGAELTTSFIGVADGQGVVARFISIPMEAQADEQWIVVVEATDHSQAAQSFAFTVTSPFPRTPTPGRSLFTRTNVYLIALGGSPDRPQIGCGDSVVPVEVEIEPTVAPLTAAINSLLAIKTRLYGNTGLYNALYQSNLSVDSIRIQNREAIIELSGNVQLGGVCDSPRFNEQLRETALQFSTVDAVSIFINDVNINNLFDASG